MTAKALRARLLEVVGDGSGRLDGYVPRELRFGSAADLENAVAEYPVALEGDTEKQVAA